MKKFFAKILSILLLLPSLCLAAPGQPAAIEVGYLPGSKNIDTDREFSIAARYESFSFVLSEAKTLNTIRWPIAYIGGSPASGDARLDIYSSTTGNVPDATLANSTTTSGSFAADTWVSQTGFSLALSAGVRYWVVVRNVDGAPATNYFAIRVGTGIFPSGWTQYDVDSAYTFAESVNSGASWANDAGSGLFPFVLLFSDSTAFGLPYARRYRALDPDATFGVYSTRERGTLFTTPANFKANVKCLSFQVAKQGSPTGSLRYRLYAGTTLIDTTATYLASTLASGGGNFPLCFTTPVTLSPSTIYRAVVSETTQSDTSSNYIQTTRFYVADSDATSQTLKPFGSATAGTYYNGSSWSDDTTSLVPFMMTLDNGSEFAVQGANYGGFW